VRNIESQSLRPFGGWRRLVMDASDYTSSLWISSGRHSENVYLPESLKTGFHSN